MATISTHTHTHKKRAPFSSFFIFLKQGIDNIIWASITKAVIIGRISWIAKNPTKIGANQDRSKLVEYML